MAVREMDRARNAGKAATPEALARYNAKHNKWIEEKVLKNPYKRRKQKAPVRIKKSETHRGHSHT